MTRNDAELNALARCYIDRASMEYAITEGITSFHFESDSTRKTWQVLYSIYAAGDEITFDRIHAAYAAKWPVGFNDTRTFSEITARYKADHKAEVAYLKSEFARRQLKALVSMMHDGISDPNICPIELAKRASTSIANITSAQRTQRTWAQAVEAAKMDFLNDTQPPAKRMAPDTLPWPHRYMDETFGPIERGELVVIAARTSNGKSSLARQVALECVLRGKQVLTHTLEVGDKELARNLAANTTRTRTRKHLDFLPDDRKNAVLKSFDAMARWSNFHLRTMENVSAEMAATATAIRSQYGLDIWIIDYLGLIEEARGTANGMNLAASIGRVTSALKVEATRQNCAVILLCQINRAGDEEPTLTHLQDSGRIEQDASRVIIIHIPKKVNGVEQFASSSRDQPFFAATIKQLKGRNHGTGSVDCRFHRESASFVFDGE